MNRHIKHWFRHYSKSFGFCENCLSLPDYMQTSDDNDDFFPDGVNKLSRLNELKLPYTSDNSLMQCNDCRAYYFYRTWAPGGSEDAMKTVNYESISKTGLPGVFLELTEALESSAQYYHQYLGKSDVLYKMYKDEFDQLEKNGIKHLDYIRSRPEVFVNDAIVCLDLHASEKDNEYYRRDLIPAEAELAELLVTFLNSLPHKNKFRENISSLCQHPNEKVGEIFSSWYKTS